MSQKLNLTEEFETTRNGTIQLIENLTPEDCQIQAVPDASPTKWHLAHTTWFFENFILKELADYKLFDDSFHYLYNSYYKGEGKHIHRNHRGFISRPGLTRIIEYRNYVDASIKAMSLSSSDKHASLLKLGIEHEQQHQELIITDIIKNLSMNPMAPAFEQEIPPHPVPSEPAWLTFDEQIAEIGKECAYAIEDFAFDNETPRHRVLTPPFALANRPVTNGEYLEFVLDGAYKNPALWLSDAWDTLQTWKITEPEYWKKTEEGYLEYRADGLRPLDLNAPVCHLSFYEAESYARYREMRLPTEFEWELAVSNIEAKPQDYQAQTFHPAFSKDTHASRNFYWGGVWEWTSSSYLPYPGFKPHPGSIGEYNGKFMNNQRVLRGGSCATVRGHSRAQYRNFFPPEATWQFTGLRLAKDI